MSYDSLCNTVGRLKWNANRRLSLAVDRAALARAEAEKALARDVLAAIRSGGDAAAAGWAHGERIEALRAEEARAWAAADVVYESRARGFALVREWTQGPSGRAE